MIVKNVGNKIVSIGQTALMPDDEVKFPASLLKNPSLQAMQGRGFIRISMEASDTAELAKAKAAKEEAKKVAPTQEDISFEQTTDFVAAPDPTAATVIRGKRLKAQKSAEEENSTT